MPNQSVPLRTEMCSTCPFRPGVDPKYGCLRDELAISAVREASRICHQTGSHNAFHVRTGKPEALCRGARDVANTHYYAMGFLSAPTDEAWDAKCAEVGIVPNCNNRPRRRDRLSPTKS